MMERQLHVRVQREDGAFWATVDEYPGVFATGDDLEELRAILEEGICLMVAEAEGEVPDLRVPRWKSSRPGASRALRSSPPRRCGRGRAPPGRGRRPRGWRSRDPRWCRRRSGGSC